MDFFKKRQVRRIMKNQGAYLVEEDAVDALIDYIERKGKILTKKAIEQASEADRTSITYDDLLNAIGGVTVLYNM